MHVVMKGLIIEVRPGVVSQQRARGRSIIGHMRSKDYDYRNCQSLFGYAAAVHDRSGGVCQLCSAGAVGVDFDLWRQMTVEHLIGESQGGYLPQISSAVARRFPHWSAESRALLARQIDEVNTITACSFCNATTSRNRAAMAMGDALDQAPDGSSPEAVLAHIVACLQVVLSGKRQDVAWKLASVRRAFDSLVAPRLADQRVVSSDGESSTAADEIAMLVERIRSDVACESEDYVVPAGYADISLALVDAVYSIQMRYQAVRRVVAAYAKASDTPDQPLAARDSPGWRERGLGHLLDMSSGLAGTALADRLFAGSRSKTRGRLKADVCVDVAGRLVDAGVSVADDLQETIADPAVRSAWTGADGLAWVTWRYFCSLNGIDGFKPDVMLVRFVSKSLGRPVSASETEQLLVQALEPLRQDHPGLTARMLDHTLWRFESGRN